MLDTKTCSSSARRIRAFALAAVGALAGGGVFLGAPRTAQAEEVSPSGKGVVGGAFLGGEIVVFVEALAGVRNGTAYLLGAGGGAIAGGVGGYFIEQSSDDGRVPAYMLAGGLALIIPALVVILDQTRYLPTEGAREDRPTNLPPSDPGKPGGSTVIGAEAKPASPTPAPGTPAPGGTPTTAPPSGTTPAPTPPAGGAGGGTQAPRSQGPQSLINLQNGGMRVGLPVPEFRPVFSATQRKALGVESAGNEVRFPVMSVSF